MNGDTLLAMAEALGWPIAVFILVALVLLRNGGLQVLMRGESTSRLTEAEKSLNRLWRNDEIRGREIAELKTQIAVLQDRWARDK